MKTAATYCRVSTEVQEREGTSLETQLEACRKHCLEKGYDNVFTFSETYSGLSLDRPELNNLREQVRAEAIDVVVCYSLDRFTRDPGHGVILTQEMEKYGVVLEAVSEDVDNSELGKLISYIRGFASKLEAEKIKERTMRGRRARAKEGKIPSGFAVTYGYDYIPVSRSGGGRRVVNEEEAKWVRQMYSWLVDEGLASAVIRDRLNDAGVPSKTGKHWRRNTIVAILKNPAYTGKTYAFTSLNHRVRRKAKEEWIELPGLTPAIISERVFADAQRRLQANQSTASRNTKRQYLLRGRVRCSQCGLAYIGGTSGNKRRDGSYRTIYKCTGRSPDTARECRNKRWSTTKLESIVLGKLEEAFKHPDLITHELEKQRGEAGQIGIFESQLQEAKRRLKAVDHEQAQLLRWAIKGFPEAQVEAENSRLNKARDTIKAQLAQVDSQIEASKQAIYNIPDLKQAIARMRGNLLSATFEEKRRMLDMLDVTVWLDGEVVTITGLISAEEGAVATSLF